MGVQDGSCPAKYARSTADASSTVAALAMGGQGIALRAATAQLPSAPTLRSVAAPRGGFVGHSVSAMIGVLAVAEQSDRFAGLVLLTPSPCYVDQDGYRGGFTQDDIDELLESLDSNYLGWSASMAPVIMGNPDRPELGQELTDSFCRTDPTIAKAFARVTFLSDQRADLARVSVPTLVLQSATDAIAPPEVGAYVNAHVRDSRLITLDTTGHCPQLSAPQATAQAIASFVAEHR